MDLIKSHTNIGNILNFIKVDILNIITWLSISGIFENIIDKMVGKNNFHTKVIIYIIILILTLNFRYIVSQK